jgi:3-deoxy-D-manno-octulosonic-acid transferase
MRTLYQLLITVGFFLAAPYYFYRLWRRGNWREGFGERFGSYSSKVKQAITNRRVIWVHAVSVGEANLAASLVAALQTRLPHHKFIVSTTTTTGMGELRRRLPAHVEKVYYPIDRRPWVRRAFAVLHPEMVVLVEAEIWPNFLWQARRRGVPVALINARISPRSFPRYRRAGFLFRDLFAGLAAVAAQSPEDARRLQSLGCRAEAVQSVGSLKFEPPLSHDTRTLDVPRLLRQAGWSEGDLILLGGSTHDGEEAALADIFRQLRTRHPRLFLVLVPRHFERSRSIGSQLDRRRVRFVYRSEVNFGRPAVPGSADCLVVNSTGELRHFYPHADVVFIGKSLIGRGGQNPVEPAAAGRAVVVGPHMQNFPDILPRFLETDAVVQVPDAAGLESAIDRLLGDPEGRKALGQRALRVVEENRGAMARTVDALVQVAEKAAR